MITKVKILKIIYVLFIYSLPIFSQVNIVPYIKITSPNGGEKWEANSTQTITWESSNIYNVKLEYSYSNGLSWNVIAPSVNASLGKYSWTIPNSQVSQVLIRIIDASNPFVYDVSDKWFTIFKTSETKKTQNLNKTTTLTGSTSVKIMPLGDSVTEGVGDDPRSVSYREELYKLLTNAGYNFYFVGNQESGLENLYPPGSPPDINDPNYYFYFNGRHHEGHGGWVADGPFETGGGSIADSVYKWLDTLTNINFPSDKPEIILLHAGTNDYYADSPSTIKNDILNIISNISGFDSNIMTIFSTLIYYCKEYLPGGNGATITEQNTLNTSLQTEAINLINLGRNVSNVDQYSVLDKSKYIDYPAGTYFSDSTLAHPFNNIHPSGYNSLGNGYGLMAHAWFSKLQTILPLLQLKVFLQGPYDINANQMTTSLNRSDLQNSPYSEAPKSVSYTIPGNITDWVLLQFRSTYNGAPVKSKSCFLREDGQVIDPDGLSENISLGINPGNYYVVVKHRNHLAVMSSGTVQLNGLTTYDFTDNQNKAYTTGPDPMAALGGGKFGMWAGDVNGDGIIKYNGLNNDRGLIYAKIGGGDNLATWSGYDGSDVNMDGIVKYNALNNDRGIIYVNIGGGDNLLTRSTQVPN